MGGRRNEVREKAFFEPIRGKTPAIGRQKNYPCDKNMKKRMFFNMTPFAYIFNVKY
jgi:hypothetical protein